MDYGIPIEGFPDYLVSKEGHVYTERGKRLRKPSLTRQGGVKITLYRDGRPYTKSLALIVAQAHLYNDHDPDIFDTPIHLDNDMQNNHVDNLAWRPRWFAIKYQKQYWQESYRNNTARIEDDKTGERYGSLVEVCQRYGLLWHDVVKSCTQGTTVFPTWKVFRFV